MAKAEGALSQAREQHAERVKQSDNMVQRAMQEVDKRSVKLVADLPEAWRPTGDITPATLEHLTSRCEESISTITSLDRDRAEADQTIRQAEATRERVRAEVAEQVTGPVKAFVGAVCLSATSLSTNVMIRSAMPGKASSYSFNHSGGGSGPR